MFAANTNHSPLSVVPAPQASDPEDVASHLETAQMLAQNGDFREALRWIRRAADAAEQAEDDRRALTLARAAAELANEIGATSSLPPPPSIPPLPRPSMPSRIRDVAPPPPRRSVPPPLPKRNTPPPPPPRVRADSMPPLTAPNPTLRAHPVPITPTLAPETTPEAPLAKHAAATDRLLEELVAQGRAVRVVTRRSLRDGSLYTVRLQSSERPPPGAREAILILKEPDTAFFAAQKRTPY